MTEPQKADQSVVMSGTPKAGYSVDSKADSTVGPMVVTMVATKADC